MRLDFGNNFFQSRVRIIAAAAIVLLLGVGAWVIVPQIHRKPPSIFDAPVDGVLDYLASDHFNRLSIEERMNFIAGIIERFRGMTQGESVAASAFFAGLAGPANEKLIDNARVLGKDIFVQGAAEYLALASKQERDRFIDQWLVQWVRFAEQATGRPSKKSDMEILDDMTRQARRDSTRMGDIDADMAQQILDFWERDIGSVASPKEQAQIFQFGPAIRQRLLTRGS